MEGIVRKYGLSRALGLVPQITDPSVSGNIVTSRLSFADFSAFYALAEKHAQTARCALDASDEDQARELWQEIFGERFPASGKRSFGEGLLAAAVTPPALAFPERPVLPKKPGDFA
jgi:hypothetical protein